MAGGLTVTTGSGTDTGIERHGDPRPTRSPRRLVTVVVVAVVLGAALALVLWVVRPFSSPAPATAATSSSTAIVQRGSLSSHTQVGATLGYAGSYQVVNKASGTYTSLPAVGQVVRDGQVLYTVDGSPVVLLYGATPAYRDLSSGMTGADVEQLNADLVALGYASSSSLSPTSDTFSSVTASALDALQAAVGLTQTGTLPVAQAVFLPAAARITAVTPTLGTSAQPGSPAMTATSTTRQVTVQLDAALQSDVKVGDPVSITLPDQSTTPGTVSFVGTVATTPSGSGSGNSSPTIEVDVALTDPAAAGSLDQAPVNVAITNATVNDVLVVPVNALLALENGGYAVEVVPAHGRHYLVPVTTGLFDDQGGSVQVSGSGLTEGMHVVVPSS